MKIEKDSKWKDQYNHKAVDDLESIFPRIELRYRPIIYRMQYKDSETERIRKTFDKKFQGYDDSIVCDLCLVTKDISNKTIYYVLQSTKTSDVNARETFKNPWRIEADLFNLMYELKYPAYVSYEENYRMINFPEGKDLPGGLQDKLKK